MNVVFETRKLGKICNDAKSLRKKFGATRGKKVAMRLQQLAAAPHLGDLWDSRLGRCHELKGDRAGQLSVDLDGPYRLIFEPDHDPVPMTEQSGLDWSRVTDVRIIEITDTHE